MLLSHGFAFIFKDNLRLRPLFKKPYDLLKLAARHKVSADILPNLSNFMRPWRLCMPMAAIKNIKPLSAEKLFDLLKTEFADYINEKLGSNMAIDYAHVYDVINVLFPEVIEGPALTITVTGDVLIVTVHATDSDYNTDLLEEHLIRFLELQAS
jgi:hypothetical protein